MAGRAHPENHPNKGQGLREDPQDPLLSQSNLLNSPCPFGSSEPGRPQGPATGRGTRAWSGLVPAGHPHKPSMQEPPRVPIRTPVLPCACRGRDTASQPAGTGRPPLPAPAPLEPACPSQELQPRAPSHPVFKGGDVLQIDFTVGNGTIKQVVSIFVIVTTEREGGRGVRSPSVPSSRSVHRIQMAFRGAAGPYFRDMG